PVAVNFYSLLTQLKFTCSLAYFVSNIDLKKLYCLYANNFMHTVHARKYFTQTK
uniref:Uncharacterized protein n=1 Tax=Ciona intestinalis TaxID=7719 RepID=H2XYG8_CIOIN